jgi:hypothetical protein
VTHNVSMHSRQTSRGVQLMFSVFFLIFFILKSRQKLANSVEYNYNMVCVCVCPSFTYLFIYFTRFGDGFGVCLSVQVLKPIPFRFRSQEMRGLFV